MIEVLVVDDDFMVARIHTGFVTRTPGFTVTGVAHTGAQALVEAERLQPDLVLTTGRIQQSLTESLRKLGLPVLSYDAQTLEEVIQNVRASRLLIVSSRRSAHQSPRIVIVLSARVR